MKLLTGTGVAVVTPFKKGGEIDFAALDQLINRLILQKADYLVVLGTTGETATLSKDEKKEIFTFFATVTGGRIPLVMGLGGNNTAELLQQLQQADTSGYSAILSVAPYYNKPNQEGLFQHYRAVSETAPLPVIMYNVPGRTGINITAETTIRIAHELPNIVATKEACGNLEQIMRIIKYCPEHFKIISGDDNLTLPIIAAGGIGVISVTANAFTEVYAQMVRYCLEGDFNRARPLHYQLTDITDMFFAEGSPGGVKAALKIMGICEDTVRLPLWPVSEALYRKIETAVRAIS